MRSPLTIERLYRPVSDVDRDTILDLEAQSFSNPWTPQAFEVMLSSPASRLYVVRADGPDIVGFCGCWSFDDELHINTVAVRADWRRRGVAYALLKHVLADTGAVRATLEVRRSNAAAIALYQKLGFRVKAVRPKYYENPNEDGLILWRNP
ncbi:MAG TPA: ribosomal protein S18-alanine N-acetyltransferase [Vicinamibacterales bacterium]